MLRPRRRRHLRRNPGAALQLAEGGQVGAGVVLFGSAGERPLLAGIAAAARPVPVDWAGRTPLPILAECFRRIDLLVTNDTGPMHLAAAVGTRTIAIFGSTSPTWTRPWGEGHVVVDHPVPCAPCFQRTCRIGTLCLNGVEAERVSSEARALLAGSEVRA